MTCLSGTELGANKQNGQIIIASSLTVASFLKELFISLYPIIGSDICMINKRKLVLMQ